MDFTPNLNLPIPNADAVPPKNISDQFPDIAIALTMLDEIIHTLQGVVAGKAETDHSQAMSTITGLVEALADKMPATTTFSLDDLEDVIGAADALVNYVLVKNASGFWVPSTALAALGVHNHAISEVVGLAELLDLLAANKADKATTVTGAGLASGGGSLSANRTITVTKATDAEHQARARDDVAATPKGVGLAVVAYNRWKMIAFDKILSGGPVTSVIKTDLANFSLLRLSGFYISSANAILAFRVSANNGASWISGASDYSASFTGTSEGSTSLGATTSSAGLFSIASGLAGRPKSFDHLFSGWNFAGEKNVLSAEGGLRTNGGSTNYVWNTRLINGAAVALSALQVYPASGNVYGDFFLEGVE